MTISTMIRVKVVATLDTGQSVLLRADKNYEND